MDFLNEDQRMERVEDGQPVVWAMVRFVQGRGEVTFPVQLIEAVRQALRSKPNKAERGKAVLDAIAQFLPATVVDDDRLPSFVIPGPVPQAAQQKPSARSPSFTLVQGSGASREPQDPSPNQGLEPLGFNPQAFAKMAISPAHIASVAAAPERPSVERSAQRPVEYPMERPMQSPAAIPVHASSHAPKQPSRADLAALQAKYERLLASEPPSIYEAYEVQRQMTLLEQKLLALGL